MVNGIGIFLFQDEIGLRLYFWVFVICQVLYMYHPLVPIGNCTAPGQYRNPSTNLCTDCPLGTYNSAKWRDECTNCVAGFTTKTMGRTSASECISKSHYLLNYWQCTSSSCNLVQCCSASQLGNCTLSKSPTLTFDTFDAHGYLYFFFVWCLYRHWKDLP